MNICTLCGKESEKFYRKSKRCQACRTAYLRDYCKRTQYHKKRYAKESIAERERHLIKKYNVTLADYDSMFKNQNGQCAICGKVQESAFDVDHCHKTGEVRGLLCTNCNRMIGHAHDDTGRLIKAANYLSRKSRRSSSTPIVSADHANQ